MNLPCSWPRFLRAGALGAMFGLITLPQSTSAAAPILGVAVFLGGVAALGGFPCFQIGQLPAGAAGRQDDRFGKARIGLRPAPRRRAMNAISGRNLGIGKVNVSHRAPSNLLRLERSKCVRRTPISFDWVQRDDLSVYNQRRNDPLKRFG